MKRYILIGLAALTAVVVLTHPDVIGGLLLLLFLGVIPGTAIVVPFWVMLPMYLLVAAAAITWLTTQPLYIGSIPTQEQTARQLARKRIVTDAKTSRYKSTRRTKRRFRTAKV